MGCAMARKLDILDALTVLKATDPGYYGDGGGLYLQVTDSGAKSWIYKFKLDGRTREMGLGPLNTIGLSEARNRAGQCRKLRLDGVDPIEARKVQRAQARLNLAQSMTFEQSAEAYIKAHKAEWKNPKSESQWRNTFKTYVYPVFGSLLVQAVDLGLVMKAIEPIWLAKNTTASLVRARIEAVLDWATVREYRTGANPARWKGHIEKLLPKCSKVHKVVHHAALPYAEMPDFMVRLRALEGADARALELTILTACRSGESRLAEWSEFDLENKLWTVPEARMKIKNGGDHIVPLSPAALAVLTAMQKVRQNKFVFPGRKKNAAISTMDTVLDKLKRRDITVHGFRSSFRDWAADCTNYPNHVAEKALAHAIGDEAEAAYRRGAMLEKRRRMMADWAKHCAPKATGQVVPMRATA